MKALHYIQHFIKNHPYFTLSLEIVQCTVQDLLNRPTRSPEFIKSFRQFLKKVQISHKTVQPSKVQVIPVPICKGDIGRYQGISGDIGRFRKNFLFQREFLPLAGDREVTPDIGSLPIKSGGLNLWVDFGFFGKIDMSNTLFLEIKDLEN